MSKDTLIGYVIIGVPIGLAALCILMAIIG